MLRRVVIVLTCLCVVCATIGIVGLGKGGFDEQAEAAQKRALDAEKETPPDTVTAARNWREAAVNWKAHGDWEARTASGDSNEALARNLERAARALENAAKNTGLARDKQAAAKTWREAAENWRTKAGNDPNNGTEAEGRAAAASSHARAAQAWEAAEKASKDTGDTEAAAKDWYEAAQWWKSAGKENEAQSCFRKEAWAWRRLAVNSPKNSSGDLYKIAGYYQNAADAYMNAECEELAKHYQELADETRAKARE